MTLKRYSPQINNGMIQIDTGRYVSLQAYRKLQAKIAEQAEQIGRLKEIGESAYDLLVISWPFVKNHDIEFETILKALKGGE